MSCLLHTQPRRARDYKRELGLPYHIPFAWGQQVEEVDYRLHDAWHLRSLRWPPAPKDSEDWWQSLQTQSVSLPRGVKLAPEARSEVL